MLYKKKSIWEMLKKKLELVHKENDFTELFKNLAGYKSEIILLNH